MNIKTYKLVPISFFENDEKMETQKEEERDGDNSRSINDIVESNLQKNNFKPSSHYIADFKLGSKTKNQMDGRGLVRDDANKLGGPIFLPNTNVLPEYSEARKLKSLDQNLKDLLADTTIPEDFKIKLYLILKQKYDNVRENLDNEKSDTDKMDFSDENQSPMSILNKVINELPNNKKGEAQKLVNIFMQQGKFLRWDESGNITHPKLTNRGSFDLRMLIKSILYKKHVSDAHTKITGQIIRPFFDILDAENLIANDGLFIRKPLTLSKYVPW